ncbi:transglycosylase family protein [Candidatus Poriferisocius sp.]|uniref:transglycosylase family protein n=1 Tax=Candidatus Poriferisocius sp. TaxID=3101276 RepID=UPI003B5A1126
METGKMSGQMTGHMTGPMKGTRRRYRVAVLATVVAAVSVAAVGVGVAPAGGQDTDERDAVIANQAALIAEQETLIVAQEALLNEYRCLFDIDTEVVPDGCPDDPDDLAPPAGTTEQQWEQLRRCESGGNYRAYNPAGPYLGAYQFNQGTWNGVAGRHYPHLVGVDPRDAEPTDQDRMAYRLWEERGWQPWPTCGAPFR